MSGQAAVSGFTPAYLQETARRIRTHVLHMAHRSRSPHVACALSCVDLLTVLYFGILRIDPAHPDGEDRDRFILSKGHGCMALYATLAERGFFAEDTLREYATDGGRLPEHPSPGCVPGIDVATGSLGHGLPIGAGLALSSGLLGSASRTFVVLSDGECMEGSTWEAAIFAPLHGLDNLVAIIDYNGLSAMGRTEPALHPLCGKWRAFGWAVREIDGHDTSAIRSALESAPFVHGKPSVVVARTTKGKGVSFMENDLEWHYRPPSAADLTLALAEIGAAPDSNGGE